MVKKLMSSCKIASYVVTNSQFLRTTTEIAFPVHIKYAFSLYP